MRSQDGRAVEFGAVIGQFLLDVLARLGLEKQDVFQQVRHAGLAIALVARADHVGHVDRDLGVGGIREQQHAQAVGQRVFA